MIPPPTTDRPTDAEFDRLITSAGRTVLRAVSERRRPWWRRMSRLGVAATAVLVVGGVAGAAVAAKSLFDATPQVETGSTSFTLDEPSPADRWLNVQMQYTCSPGEHFTVTVGDDVVFDESCDAMYYDPIPNQPELAADQTDQGPVPTPHPPGADRGLFKSIPIGDVSGRTVKVDSTLSHDYRVEAVFSPTSEMSMLVLPGRRDDGNVDWATPDYVVNEYGLTVGVPRLNTPENQWPDLYPVRFEGRTGYLLGSEMHGGLIVDRDERIEIERQRRRDGLIDAKGNVYQRVYAADGKTVLGKMLVGSSS